MSLSLCRSVAEVLITGERWFVAMPLMLQALEQLDPRRVSTGSVEDQKQPIAFMFTGQGSQYPGMGAGLYEHEPVFRYHVDECAELLKPHLGCDLRDVIYPRRAEAAGRRRRRKF